MSNLTPPPERLALEEASTADLVREALDEAKQLVRIEIELARAEITQEIAQAKKAAISVGVAATFSLIGTTLLVVAIPLAFGASAIASLIVGGIILVFAAIAAIVGYALLPKKPLEHTRERLKTNMHQLKEHVA